MESMKDKEVGEMWHEARKWYNELATARCVLRLIHKLVDERAMTNYFHNSEDHLRQALCDFNIPEEEYKEWDS